jgi:1-acyl-sn-glycerol-3-phosphate acyltransferase
MKSSEYSHPGQSKILFKILYWIGKYLYRIRFKINIETTVPYEIKDGPLLILAKHSSNHDIPSGIPALVDVIGRPAWCIIKEALAKPIFLGFFLKIGGIPVERKNPEKSKHQLLYARKILHEGNALVIFPEQSRFRGKMGRGKSGGFRFITGKPKEAISVLVVGFEYKRGFPRGEINIKLGTTRQYSKQNDPEQFLQECMVEIAQLSNLTYKYNL